MTDPSLKHKTTISLFWNFIDKFGQQVINLISGIILMRTLAPSEYGLIGALTVFIAFSSILIDSGFTRSLLNRISISDDEYSTVFYFNLGFSRSEEHTSELQSRPHLVCRLLLEKKKKKK